MLPALPSLKAAQLPRHCPPSYPSVQTTSKAPWSLSWSLIIHDREWKEAAGAVDRPLRSHVRVTDSKDRAGDSENKPSWDEGGGTGEAGTLASERIGTGFCPGSVKAPACPCTEPRAQCQLVPSIGRWQGTGQAQMEVLDAPVALFSSHSGFL